MIKQQCDQQAYIFQSGCASKCGPETMAYTRDQVTHMNIISLLAIFYQCFEVTHVYEKCGKCF